jgi:DNA-binding CsgD family transcriptional regulator
VRHDPGAILDFAHTAASAGPLPDRAEALLRTLGRLVPADGAWVALVEPCSGTFTTVASTSLDDDVLQWFAGPVTAREIELVGLNGVRPPMSPSDLPYPAEELETWRECLLPAGYHEGLGVGLFAGGRHVGHVGLLRAGRESPSPAARRLLSRLAPVLASAIDPMRTLLVSARVVRGGTGGVVVRTDGATDVLPGLADDPLLTTGSPVMLAARARIASGQVMASFLWPCRSGHLPDGHVRITVVAAAAATDVPSTISGVVVVSPAGDLHDLTARELEVLGLLVEGCSNREVARALVVAQRTVAAHIEHILVKLSVATRTLAAVRAEREGLYVPRRSVAAH